MSRKLLARHNAKPARKDHRITISTKEKDFLMTSPTKKFSIVALKGHIDFLVATY